MASPRVLIDKLLRAVAGAAGALLEEPFPALGAAEAICALPNALNMLSRPSFDHLDFGLYAKSTSGGLSFSNR